MAITTSILNTIGSMIVVSYSVDSDFKESGDTLSFIKAISLIGIPACIASVIEAKKEKPSIEAIAIFGIINMFGIAVNVYELLVDKEAPKFT
jgi:hypothetical protein